MEIRNSSDPMLARSPNLKTRKADLIDLGFVSDYSTVWELQKNAVRRRIEGSGRDSVIFVEHDHVLTLGRSAHNENVLVRGLPTFEIERGGDVTYHGPGQLVVYPVLSLTALSMSIRQYVEALESAVIKALRGFGIIECQGKLGAMTGVWVEDARKIASIGVATSHWVTYHGLALNVNTDLSFFERIKPCGFEASVMTSIQKELGGKQVDFEKVKDELASSIAEVFQFDFNLSRNFAPPNFNAVERY